jgi:hypothetical protein
MTQKLGVGRAIRREQILTARDHRSAPADRIGESQRSRQDVDERSEASRFAVAQVDHGRTDISRSRVLAPSRARP